jgi:hypothetical protein
MRSKATLPSTVLLAAMLLAATLPVFSQSVLAAPTAGKKAPPQSKTYPKPNGREWPKVVSVPPNFPPPKTIQEDAAARTFLYETEHYQLRSDLRISPADLKELGRIFESTWLLNCLLPLNWEPTVEAGNEKFQARFFAKREDYKAAGGLSGSGGVYLPQQKTLLISLPSIGAEISENKASLENDTDRAAKRATLIHEITHQMMHRWLGNLPIWLSEGSAEYVAAADYNAGKFRFKQQEQQVIAQLRKRLVKEHGPAIMMPLDELLNIDGKKWTTLLAKQPDYAYGSALALTYYFYHLDGPEPAAMPIHAFLNEVRNGTPYLRPLGQHLLRGRPNASLQDEITRAYAKLGLKIEWKKISPETTSPGK